MTLILYGLSVNGVGDSAVRAPRASDKMDSVSFSRVLNASLASHSVCWYSERKSSHPASLNSQISKSWNMSVGSSGILLVSVSLQSSGVKTCSR